MILIENRIDTRCRQVFSDRRWRTMSSTLILRRRQEEKKCKTKGLHHVFIWGMDTVNPEDEKKQPGFFLKKCDFNFFIF